MSRALIDEVRKQALLDAYNDGIVDGMIAATAILSDGPDGIKRIKEEIEAKRALLRSQEGSSNG